MRLTSVPDHIRPVLERLCLEAEQRGYARGVVDGKASGQAELIAGMKALQSVMPSLTPMQSVARFDPVNLSTPVPTQATDGDDDDFDIDGLLDGLFGGGQWSDAEKQEVVAIAIVAIREAAEAQGVDPEPHIERLMALVGNPKATERVMMGHPVFLAWRPVPSKNQSGRYKYRAEWDGADGRTRRPLYGAKAEEALRKNYGGKAGEDASAEDVAKQNVEHRESRDKAHARVKEVAGVFASGKVLRPQEWDEFTGQMAYLTGNQLQDIRKSMLAGLVRRVKLGKNKGDRIEHIKSAIKAVVEFGVTKPFQLDEDKTGGSLAEAVKRAGGIDPSKSELQAHFSDADEMMQYGLGGVMKKGGRHLDELAEELESQGHLVVPAGTSATQALVDALQSKRKSADHDDRDYWESQLQKSAAHDAAMAAHASANEEPEPAPDVGATADTGDTSFDFGDNATDEQAVAENAPADEPAEVTVEESGETDAVADDPDVEAQSPAKPDMPSAEQLGRMSQQDLADHAVKVIKYTQQNRATQDGNDHLADVVNALKKLREPANRTTDATAPDSQPQPPADTKPADAVSPIGETQPSPPEPIEDTPDAIYAAMKSAAASATNPTVKNALEAQIENGNHYASESPKDGKRLLIRRLVSAAHQLHMQGLADEASQVDALLERIPGMRRTSGKAGESTPFDPLEHMPNEGAESGSNVNIDRPGYVLDEPDGHRYIVLRAQASTSPQQPTPPEPVADTPAPQPEPQPAASAPQPAVEPEPEVAPTTAAAPAKLTPAQVTAREKSMADAVAAAQRGGKRLTTEQRAKVRADAKAKFEDGLAKPPTAKVEEQPTQRFRSDLQPIDGVAGRAKQLTPKMVQAADGKWYLPHEIQGYEQAKDAELRLNDVDEAATTKTVDGDVATVASGKKAEGMRYETANQAKEFHATGELVGLAEKGPVSDEQLTAIAERAELDPKKVKDLYADVVNDRISGDVMPLLEGGGKLDDAAIAKIADAAFTTPAKVKAQVGEIKKQQAFAEMRELKRAGNLTEQSIRDIAKKHGVSDGKLGEVLRQLRNASDPNFDTMKGNSAPATIADVVDGSDAPPAPQPAPAPKPTKAKATPKAKKVGGGTTELSEEAKPLMSEVERHIADWTPGGQWHDEQRSTVSGGPATSDAFRAKHKAVVDDILSRIEKAGLSDDQVKAMAFRVSGIKQPNRQKAVLAIRGKLTAASRMLDSRRS